MDEEWFSPQWQGSASEHEAEGASEHEAEGASEHEAKDAPGSKPEDAPEHAQHAEFGTGMHSLVFAWP